MDGIRSLSAVRRFFDRQVEALFRIYNGEEIMRCQKCGHEIQETAHFCAKRGMSLQDPDKALSEKTRTDYPLSPERKQVTGLFLDLTGYTAITEKLDPELLKELTGRIFAGVKEIVARV